MIAELAGRHSLAIAWEIDPACLQVAERRMPWLHQRGDLLKDDATAVAKLIQEHDPEEAMTVVWTAASPCQDFSRMRTSGPGHEGGRGSLFLKTVDFQTQLFSRLGKRRTAVLYENVVMTKTNADTITEALGYAPVLPAAATLAGLHGRGCGGPPSTGDESPMTPWMDGGSSGPRTTASGTA